MWSPDGRHLAYRSDHGGEACPGTVHVTDPKGNEIASFPGTGWRVSWSPDSTRVATWIDDSESRTIGVYGIDGMRQAVIALPPEFAPPGDYDPLWSPDGGSLLMKLAPPVQEGSGSYPSTAARHSVSLRRTRDRIGMSGTRLTALKRHSSMEIRSSLQRRMVPGVGSWPPGWSSGSPPPVVVADR